MKITAQNYAIALFEALAEVRTEDHEKVLDNFLSVLQSNGHLEMYEEIEKEFLNYDSKQKGQIPATATFAKNYSDKTLFDSMNKIFEKQLVIDNRIKEEIIGGVMIETEEERLDATVKGYLEQLKKSLKK